MELWQNREALRACVLAQLTAAGGEWTPAGEIARRFGLAEDAVVPALAALAADGCAESCDWPRDGRMQPHFRATEFGRCMAETVRARWEQERGLLDRFLLSDAAKPS